MFSFVSTNIKINLTMRYFCILFFSIISIHIQAQNIFPEKGNVGIGTSSPKTTLDINGHLLLRGVPDKNGSALFTGEGDKELNKYLILINSPGLSSASGLKAGGVLVSDAYNYANPGKNDLIVKGNVGIGVPSPSTNLHVNKHMYVGDDTFSNPDNWGATINLAHAEHSRILLEERKTGVQTALWAHTSGNNKYGNARVGTLSNHDFSVITNGNPKVTVKREGNVGIGTTKPTEKLEVKGVIKIPAATNIDNDSPGIILISDDDFKYDNTFLNHYGFGFHAYQDESSPEIGNNTYVSGYYGVDFFTRGKNRLRINHDGKVGIGTTKPDMKLTVNGKIHATGIRVDKNITADYVFQKYYTGASALKPNYNMPSLQEVEQFIKRNYHLPEIPSAKQVKQEGLVLEDMTVLLLQKIEELTLYTIQQQKEIEKLNGENTVLKQLLKDVEMLKEKLEMLKK